jgi:SAM-dependent methyltransferase
MIIRLSVWRIRHLSLWSGITYFVLFFIEKLLLIIDMLLNNENAAKCICCGESFSRFLRFIDYDYMAGCFRCPYCGSHQRHRLLHYFLQREVFPKHGNSIVLRFAPEAQFDFLMKRYPKLLYFGTDIKNKDFSSRLSFLSDAQSLPLLNKSVDLVVSIHVLEHLSNDIQAIREISRVLSPKGVAIVMVPETRKKETLEYDKPDPMEHYHYRAYGKDFIERLFTYFDVSVINAKMYCDHRRLGFGSEKLFVCKNRHWLS